MYRYIDIIPLKALQNDKANIHWDMPLHRKEDEANQPDIVVTPSNQHTNPNKWQYEDLGIEVIWTWNLRETESSIKIGALDKVKGSKEHASKCIAETVGLMNKI